MGPVEGGDLDKETYVAELYNQIETFADLRERPRTKREWPRRSSMLTGNQLDHGNHARTDDGQKKCETNNTWEEQRK